MKPQRVGMSVGEAVAKALADGSATEGPGVKVPADPAEALAAGIALGRKVNALTGEVSEAEFQQQVINLAHARGWTVAHFRSVRVARPDGSTYWQTPVEADGKGFLDLELLRERLVKVELKVGTNRMTAEQGRWLAGYARAGVEVHCWFPKDWPTICEVLK